MASRRQAYQASLGRRSMRCSEAKFASANDLAKAFQRKTGLRCKVLAASGNRATFDVRLPNGDPLLRFQAADYGRGGYEIGGSDQISALDIAKTVDLYTA